MSKKKKEQAGSSRRHFSVSKEFSEVENILDALPDRTMSRFVCEAILHYSEMKNNPEWLLERIESIMGKRTELLHLEQSLKERDSLAPVMPASPVVEVAPVSPVQSEISVKVAQEPPAPIEEEIVAQVEPSLPPEQEEKAIAPKAEPSEPSTEGKPPKRTRSFMNRAR